MERIPELDKIKKEIPLGTTWKDQTGREFQVIGIGIGYHRDDVSERSYHVIVQEKSPHRMDYEDFIQEMKRAN